MRTQAWQTATENNSWKTLNKGSSKLRRLVRDLTFGRRYLGHVGYKFSKAKPRLNQLSDENNERPET